ncbi:hypothetical protein JKX24_24790 [Serratia proteamaculans]|uniref:Ead/Ea22-like family protein n=1 Tax=Serratia proteamaculans TaxID=28151 RepID=A0A7U0RLX7_SERPR|nr:hypothetical protein [Serratia proteamaculans]MBO1502165.1 hypothetical protein [Serratia proteamaculans]QQX53329.1 hypothetical protein JKX24_24790 [Serratia proteamaculans]
MIKRFNPDFSLSISHELAYMRETPEGGYVAHGDYATLFSELELVKADRDAQQKRADALAVENAELNSGCGFFAYDPDNGFEEFKTKEEAIAAAESYIDYYRGEACDGWPDEVAQVSWGIIMQESTRVNERPRTNDDSCDPAIETVCDYALLPNIETPATSAALAAIEAWGVDKTVAVIFLRDLFEAATKLREAK